MPPAAWNVPRRWRSSPARGKRRWSSSGVVQQGTARRRRCFERVRQGARPGGRRRRDAHRHRTWREARRANPRQGPARSASVVDLPDLTTQRLAQVLIGPEADKPAGWIGAYFINYLDGEERSRRWPEWTGAITSLGPELWHLFAGSLHSVLKERGLRSGAGVLGARRAGSEFYLWDSHTTPPTPALCRRPRDCLRPEPGALATARRRRQGRTCNALAAIVNPTGDLPGTEKEGEIVASHFEARARVVLQRAAARRPMPCLVPQREDHWHFASHGAFQPEDARSSALCAARGMVPLTVGQLLETDGLGRPRLVVRSRPARPGFMTSGAALTSSSACPPPSSPSGLLECSAPLWPVSRCGNGIVDRQVLRAASHRRDSFLPRRCAVRKSGCGRQAATDLGPLVRRWQPRSVGSSGQLTEIEET